MPRESKNPDPEKSRSLSKREQELRAQIEALEARLEDSNRQNDELRDELDALLYYLSHDLRAPLRGIDGYSQALLEDCEGKINAMSKAYLEYIRDSSNHLSSLIDGLLRLYRLGRAKLEPVPVDLSEIAQTIVHEFQVAHPDRRIEFHSTSNLHVQADPKLIQTLLVCLFDNAFKFTAKHPQANLVMDKMEENGRTTIFIKDDGTGFDMAYVDQLFKPFQRLHGQHEFEGLGLGLAIAQRIIQRHNGKIWAIGEPEKGATIYFTFE